MVESTQSRSGFGASRDASAKVARTMTKPTAHAPKATARTKGRLTEKFQIRATPRNAQYSHKLLDKDTVADTSNLRPCDQVATGSPRRSNGNNMKCKTKAFAQLP